MSMCLDRGVSFRTACLVVVLLVQGGGLFTNQTKEALSAEVLYNEAYRPQFHFTYKKGWSSDSNGLFYYKGEYHYFSQHNPAGPGLDYGNIHWGHAVSSDLVHWTELEPALAPDSTGPIFSGTSVVDWDNTSGLQTGDEKVIVAFYTAAGYILPENKPGVQCIAYSNDRGRSWTKYAGNPVLKEFTHLNRDPKVFWHEPTKKWIMVITLNTGAWNEDNRFMILTSPNLKEWTETQRFEMPTACDCPDMFELPVDGDKNNTRWVIWGGDGTHAIGTFDGRAFAREGSIHLPLVTWQQKGGNGYSAQTFSDVDASDGRRIQMTSWFQYYKGQFRGMFKGASFCNPISFPVELTLRTFPEGIRLCRKPVKEIELLHKKRHCRTNVSLSGGDNPLAGVSGDLLDIRAEIDPGDATEIGFTLRGVEIKYDVKNRKLSCFDVVADVEPINGRIQMQILLDRTVLELFANAGKVSISDTFIAKPEDKALRMYAKGGAAKIISLDVYELESIWPQESAERQAADISLAKSPFVFGAGGVGNSMDPMPFYHEGTWHLFIMQTNPLGIAHHVSRDLVNWDIRPLAIPGGVATGTVIAHEGRFYFLYTASQTVHLATSDNLDDWQIYEHNPVATVDGTHYAGANFRDPYVFYNEADSCWWMLIAAEVPKGIRFRAACVGLYKSRDLLAWQAAEPLWAPSVGARHECPQVIQEDGQWYLFTLLRETQYRVAESLEGPWLRPSRSYLGPHTVLVGSRLASDGKRWVSFPFLCARQGNQDFGDIVQAEVYAVPRQLDFYPDGRITERPVTELIEAMHALPAIDPLADVATLSGRWDVDMNGARSVGGNGTLLLKNGPADLYFEADVTLPTANMEASILVRADSELTRGYKLWLQPQEGLVSLRPFSYWDRDRALLTQRADLPIGRPFKVRVFLSGTVMEAFVDDRVVLSSRVYKFKDGFVALDVVDGAAVFEEIVIRRLAGDNHDANIFWQSNQQNGS